MTTLKTRKIVRVFGRFFTLLFIVKLNAGQNNSGYSAFLKGPYLQNVRPDAITIMWESKEPAIGKVVFGKTPSFGSAAAETASATIHELTLSGLEAETVYHYQVISGGVKSAVYTFKTSAKKDSPFSFVVYGDNKNGPFNHEKNANLILSKNPHFVIHNGDLVDNGKVYKQWEKLFFTPARKMMSQIPLFPSLGNHENHAKHYYDFFSLPNNERWYSFDYGNAHFVVLDSDIKEKEKEAWDEQLDWLREDLEKNTAVWTFVNFHHTILTAGGNYYDDGRIFRKNLLHPIFEKYGVDIVLVGHDHNYERTYPIVSRRKEAHHLHCLWKRRHPEALCRPARVDALRGTSVWLRAYSCRTGKTSSTIGQHK
jgi:predicted phosphodiesterase